MRPDQAWLADITCIRLPTACAWLAAILEAFSRRGIGWPLSQRSDTTLALAALEQALRERQPAPGLLHHSAQGVQDASAAYGARLEAAGAQSSMAAAGTPSENARAERCFRTLPHAEVSLNDYRTFAAAAATLDRCIGDVDNTTRLPSALGDRPLSANWRMLPRQRRDRDVRGGPDFGVHHKPSETFNTGKGDSEGRTRRRRRFA